MDAEKAAQLAEKYKQLKQAVDSQRAIIAVLIVAALLSSRQNCITLITALCVHCVIH